MAGYVAPWHGEYLARGAGPTARVPALRGRIARDPGDAAAHHELGLIHLNALGDLAGAEAHFRAAVARDAAHAGARYELAALCYFSDRLDEAIDGFCAALALQPPGGRRAKLRHRCEQALTRRTRETAARVRALGVGRAEHLARADAARARGAALSKEGAFRKAIEAHDEGVAHARAAAAAPAEGTAPGGEGAAEAGLRVASAVCWMKLAEAAPREAEEVAPVPASARARERADDRPAEAREALDKAVASCDAALEADAGNAAALYRRAAARESRLGVGDLDAARADLERAAARAPDAGGALAAAIARLRARVDERLRRQAAAERKLWARAFS